MTLLALVARADADSSPCAQVQTELQTLNAALELYQLNHGGYPPADRWFEALVAALVLRQRLGLTWSLALGFGVAVRLGSLAVTYAARPAAKALFPWSG